jgi:succinate dehydrogenase/fumarate reductase-like Fe-S protein
MSDHVIASVFRFDPNTDKKPYFKEYQVTLENEMSVLVLLNRIQNEIDPTLSFRNYCCGLQMCKSCLMKINHRKRFACLTLVRPGESVMIEPATYPKSHIKDLVVKLSDKEQAR